jgi:hypothetical protein
MRAMQVIQTRRRPTVIIKLVLPAELAMRIDALAPLAARARVARRLIELGLGVAESRGLMTPQSAAGKTKS